LPGTRAAMYAWIHIVKDRPWLESYSSCVAVERVNSNEIVTDGGMSSRMGERLIQDLGLTWKDLVADDVHRKADDDHTSLTWGIVEKYATDHLTQQAAFEAAAEALEIYRSFFNTIADFYEQL